MALIVAGALAVSGAQVLAQPSAATAAGGKKTIAVVDVVKVFNSVNAKATGDAEIEKLAKDLDAERKVIESDLEALKKEMAQLKPDSDMYKETIDKALRKGLELQDFSDYMRERLTMEQRVRTAALYRQINDQIKTYAEANGIILVLSYDKDDMSSATTPQELQSRITVRKVLYASDSLDITRDIIELMNAAAHLGGGH
jgi:Skp family chaperone for outer membrane proteins